MCNQDRFKNLSLLVVKYVPILMVLLVFQFPAEATETSVCSAYYEFLENTEAKNAASCDQNTRFLIEHRDLEKVTFLQKYRIFFLEDSPFEIFINGIETALAGDAINGFLWLDSAEIRIYNSFDRDGLHRRRYVYSSLLKKLKLLALTGYLKPNFDVGTPYQSFGFSKGLGEKYQVFDDLLLRADVLLLCLIRVDNHAVSFDEVVGSKFFPNVLQKK